MESLRQIPAPNTAPPEITLYREDLQSPRFTPRELRTIKEVTGGSFAQVLQNDDSDDRFVVFAWLKLRREGYDVEWSAMDDVVIEVKVGSSLDPTSDELSERSPASAATGE